LGLWAGVHVEGGGGGALMCFKEFIVLGSWGFCERLMIS
jgi:hypothetical protein